MAAGVALSPGMYCLVKRFARGLLGGGAAAGVVSGCAEWPGIIAAVNGFLGMIEVGSTFVRAFSCLLVDFPWLGVVVNKLICASDMSLGGGLKAALINMLLCCCTASRRKVSFGSALQVARKG